MAKQRPKQPTCPTCGGWGGPYGQAGVARARRGGRAYLRPLSAWKGGRPERPIRVYYPLVRWRDWWRVCDDPYHSRPKRRPSWHKPPPDLTQPPPQLAHKIDPLDPAERSKRNRTKRITHKDRQGKGRR